MVNLYAQQNFINLLVVDDDATNVEFSKAMLEMLGYKVDAVHSGAEAIEHCNRTRYNIIFMDLEMPEMDGFQTTEIIRDSCILCKESLIIALAATLNDKEKVFRCIQSGMDDCIAKPLKPDVLKTRMPKWLKRAG